MELVCQTPIACLKNIFQVTISFLRFGAPYHSEVPAPYWSSKGISWIPVESLRWVRTSTNIREFSPDSIQLMSNISSEANSFQSHDQKAHDDFNYKLFWSRELFTKAWQMCRILNSSPLMNSVPEKDYEYFSNYDSMPKNQQPEPALIFTKLWQARGMGAKISKYHFDKYSFHVAWVFSGRL